MTMDILPTCAALASAAAPPGLDGTTLVPHLVEGSALPERDLFWRIDASKAVRRGPWKLVVEEDRVFLFNLETDIGEKEDIAAQHPALVNELLVALHAWEKDVDETGSRDSS